MVRYYDWMSGQPQTIMTPAMADVNHKTLFF